MLYLCCDGLADVAAMQYVVRNDKSLRRKKPQLQGAGTGNGSIRSDQADGNECLTRGVKRNLETVVAGKGALRKKGGWPK